MSIIIINPLYDSGYRVFIEKHPHTTIFHSPQWLQLFSKTYQFTPKCVVKLENRTIQATIPYMETKGITGKKKLVTLPFTDYCEPLICSEDNGESVFRALFSHLTSHYKCDVELRGGKSFLYNKPVFSTCYLHSIDLTSDLDKLFKSFSSATRRNIRKADKEGIHVEISTTLNGMKEFYRLNSITRREHGLPPQPWSFFKNILSIIFQKDQGFLTLAYAEEKVVAANLYLIYNNKAVYKYGASDKKYQHFRPSNAAMWEGIKYCQQLNCSELNLGRTELHHTGLLRYKRGFNSEETQLNYYKYDTRKNVFISSDVINNRIISSFIFSKLPLSILQGIGTLVYKYMS